MMRPENGPPESVNYKKKYQELKKKLRLLVYEQESFIDELRKAQRKLLKVSRDRSFLLDRLLQYEHVENSSSDSESTVSSDSGNELPRKEASGPLKKKRPAPAAAAAAAASSAAAHHFPPAAGHPSTSAGMGSGIPPSLVALNDPASGPASTSRLPKEPPKKKPKVTVKKISAKSMAVPSKLSPGISAPASRMLGPGVSSALASILEQPIPSTVSVAAVSMGHLPRATLSREEIERHLDLKHSAKPQFLSIDMMPHSLPDDIFSHDNSNQDCGEPPMDIKVEVDDSDLVIDM